MCDYPVRKTTFFCSVIFYFPKIEKNHRSFENPAQEVHDFSSWGFELDKIRDYFPRDHPNPENHLTQFSAKLFFSFSNLIFLALDLNAVSLGLHMVVVDFLFRIKEYEIRESILVFFAQILPKKIHYDSIWPLWLQIEDFSLWFSFQLLFQKNLALVSAV